VVEKVAAYRFSNRFKKEYADLPKEVQEAFDKKFRLFLNNTDHPSLRIKKIKGTENRWAGSVTMNYRFTFQIFEDTVLFRRIGTHNVLKREGKE
jgi:mRNA interferase RelE/StbE